MDEQNTTPQATKSKMPLFLMGLVALVIIGGIGFFAMQSGNKSAQPATDTQQQTAEATPAEAMTSEETVISPVAEEGQVQEFTVDASNFKFSVLEMRVKQGDTVRIVFTNTAGTHDWVIDEFNARTKILQTGGTETVEFVADQAGTFEYYCSVGQHRQMGMKGNLIVE